MNATPETLRAQSRNDVPMEEHVQSIKWNDNNIVVRATRHCLHFNDNEYRKGVKQASGDYKNGRDFGATCYKLTYSFCKGYLNRWNHHLMNDGIEPIRRLVKVYEGEGE